MPGASAERNPREPGAKEPVIPWSSPAAQLARDCRAVLKHSEAFGGGVLRSQIEVPADRKQLGGLGAARRRSHQDSLPCDPSTLRGIANEVSDGTTALARARTRFPLKPQNRTTEGRPAADRKQLEVRPKRARARTRRWCTDPHRERLELRRGTWRAPTERMPAWHAAARTLPRCWSRSFGDEFVGISQGRRYEAPRAAPKARARTGGIHFALCVR
jgi:hypothetical protein